MLRTIQEDESDHAANAVDSLDSLSAAAADGFDDDEVDDERDSVLSVAGALADPEGGAHRTSSQRRNDKLLKEQSKKKSKRKRRRRRIKRRWATWRSFAVMGVVVVAAAAIVVAIIVTDNGSDGGDGGGTATPANSSTTTPTPAPTTAAPTIDPDVVANLDALISEIQVDLDSSSVPEHTKATLLAAREKARSWMLTRDLLRDEVLADPTSVRFAQRYVLCLAFYSMQFNNGNVTEEEEDATLFAEESECQWLNVYCDVAIVDQTNTTTITLPVIRRIQWNDVKAVGVLPPELRSLQFLQELNVAANSLRGVIPQEWFSSPAPVLAAADTSIGFLPFLYFIDCTYNNISGNLPIELWTLPSLRFVYLTNNSLTGSLPSSDDLTTMDKSPSVFLQDIWIDNNQLSGSIPSWIFSLSILQSFIGEHNSFSGSLEIENGILPSTLVTLDLSFNKLSGVIPKAVFEGVSLTSLYLDHNQFTSMNYPTSRPEHNVTLVSVWLQENQLQGVIPADFGEPWLDLQQLNIQCNQLTGCISARGCEADAQTGSGPYWPNLQDLCAGSTVTCACCNCVAQICIA